MLLLLLGGKRGSDLAIGHRDDRPAAGEDLGLGQTGGGGEDDIGHFRREVKKMYPDRDFVRLDLSDPIFSVFYKMKSLEMIAPYIFPGQLPVEFLGLRDAQGNLQMILNNNNDLSEFFEWIDQGRMSMHDASTALQFGINYAIYALTH